MIINQLNLSPFTSKKKKLFFRRLIRIFVLKEGISYYYFYLKEIYAQPNSIILLSSCVTFFLFLFIICFLIWILKLQKIFY